MLMLKKSRCLVLAMALILLVVSCNVFAAKKPIKLVFGHILAADHYFCEGDKYFKQLVEKNSKGQVVVDYYPASQLGNANEQIMAIMSGGQQMGCFGMGGGPFAGRLSKLATLELPYLFRDEAHYLKVTRKIVSLLDQNELAAKVGVRVLSARIQPARHLSTKFPVNKIEDIKGVKIRVPENAPWIAYWKACGAIPVALPAGDVYTALATGTVDGLEFPMDSYYFLKFYEQQKYLALIGWMRNHFMLIINSNTWNSLTKKQQKIVQDAADKSSEMINKTTLDYEAKYKKMLEGKGIKFTTPDTAPFKKIGKTICKQFGDAELIKKFEAVK
jgi:tripartite ATP-independent transporter DctP family solute receptor